MRYLQNESMKRIFLPLIVVSTALFSCSKDSSTNQSCDITEANIVGSYKLTAASYKASPTSAPIDVYSLLEQCERDDIGTFKADHTVSNADVGVVCNPPNNYNDTWRLTNGNLVQGGDSAKVKSFDCKTLVLSTVDQQTAGDETTFTFTKQ